jgi:stringent starvation protein B
VKTKSKRPYLLGALFEWIVDSELTPYILVAASDSSVVVPQRHVSDGKIVLNISPAAVRDLAFDDETVRFNGRFGGTPFAVEVPVAHVLAIYAKDTGDGMMFDAEQPAGDSLVASESAVTEAADETDSRPNTNTDKKSAPGSHLKVIK